MRDVPDAEARACGSWLDEKGMHFHTGPNPETDLTDAQILEQCKMYIAALRIADEFGCDVDRHPVSAGTEGPGAGLRPGGRPAEQRRPAAGQGRRQRPRTLCRRRPLPHFNEVDECAGLDALVTNRVWPAMGLDPATTLHDVRWGEHYKGDGIDDFVWVFQISGAVPASHLAGGYAKAQ